MNDHLVVDFDDFGADHIISDQCQSHDCRVKLDQLHYANANFKVTLFTILGEVTAELAQWCKANSGWVELAVHGFYHGSNYECEKMTYEEFDEHMQFFSGLIEDYFVKGFKAPGWQISDDAYRWLNDNGWWVADQAYNNSRRPESLPAYINSDGTFYTHTAAGDSLTIPAWHGHTWNCVGNGIYETYEQVEQLIKSTTNFKTISELF
jgi:hypothetical protein